MTTDKTSILCSLTARAPNFGGGGGGGGVGGSNPPPPLNFGEGVSTSPDFERKKF